MVWLASGDKKDIDRIKSGFLKPMHINMGFFSYYRTRSYSSNNSSFLFYLEVISYH